ncbi:hypothetical protein KAU33_03910 [Candidatus Dependentiae bacterium]|nr:hypothetical protein [Candidatus Dependentiae bacterium]
MEKKFINELPEEERLKIGEIVKNMAKNYSELRSALFVIEEIDGEKEVIDEKIYNSSEIMETFMAWIKGNSLDYIGDTIFQAGGAIPREILKSIGITDIDEEVSEFA